MANEKQIFPKEVIENSVEKHFADYNPHSRVMYLLLLALFMLGFALLFIIRVDVTVRSDGSIRALQERAEIRSPVPGIIDSLFISENQAVLAGDALLTIRSQGVREKSAAINAQRADISARHEDLRRLLAGSGAPGSSQLYQQQYALYRQRVHDAQLRLNLASKAYQRFAELYRTNAISAAEFERYEFEFNDARSALRLIEEQQRSQWQGDLNRLESEQRQLNAQQAMVKEEQSLYTLRAAVRGTVQHTRQMAPGSFVAASELLGVISPDSGLIAEVHVSTSDIGMLRPGQRVKLQVDAYDYHVWGSLEGKILSISEDVFTDKQQPYFRVLCMPQRRVLRLRNGTEGPLKKGMSVQARFVVARRSLFQLLYDDLSDWLNPNDAKTNGST